MPDPLASPSHGGHIVIGLRDLYDQIQTLSAGNASLSAKVDTALITHTLAQQSIATQLSDFRADVNDHEMRIRVVESRPYISPKSMWLALGTVNAFLVTGLIIIQLVVK